MSESNQVEVSIVEETGTLPNTSVPNDAAFKILPVTGQSLGPIVRYIESQTLNANRNLADLIRVSFSAGGALPMEMRFAVPGEAMFEVMRAVLCASAEVSAATVTSVTCVAGLGAITKNGAFAEADFLVGDIISISGCAVAADNGYAVIQRHANSGDIGSPAPEDGIFVDKTFVTGSLAGATIKRHARMVNAATHRNFAILIHRKDLSNNGKYLLLRKSVFSGMDINVNTGAITTANLSVVAGSAVFGSSLSAVGCTGTPTFTQPAARTVMDAISVPLMRVGGVDYECTRIQIAMDNNAAAVEKIGTPEATRVARRQFRLTGQQQWYYDSSTEQQKYAQNQLSTAALIQEDGNGNGWSYSIPRFKWSNARGDTSGPQQDDYFQGDYSAIVDATGSRTVLVQRIVGS